MATVRWEPGARRERGMVARVGQRRRSMTTARPDGYSTTAAMDVKTAATQGDRPTAGRRAGSAGDVASQG